MTFVFTWFTFIVTLVLIAAFMGAVQGTCAYLILLERKIAAWTQDRIGPNRVGPMGLLQPIADGIKFLLKEDVIPSSVDRLFYLLAPGISISCALLAFTVVPFGQTTPAPRLIDHREHSATNGQSIWPQTKQEEIEVLKADEQFAADTKGTSFVKQLDEYNNSIQFVIAPHLDIGIVWVFAISSLAVYAIVLGGWSSNNKYSLLGSLRSSAQLISYEIPLGMSVLGVMLVTGSLNLETILQYQQDHGWNVLFQPIAALLFITSVFAECNRVPFDLPEAEQELVGGYHTEYSAMKFAMFFLAEYTHMVTTSFLVIILFFGGWHLPWLVTSETTGLGGMILKLVVFAAKVGIFLVVYMFIRWTIPRFRFDQLMGLAWKVMMPMALLSFLIVLVVKHYGISPWVSLPLSLLLLIGAGTFTIGGVGEATRDKKYVRGIRRSSDPTSKALS